jgi:hypothetical protein
MRTWTHTTLGILFLSMAAWMFNCPAGSADNETSQGSASVPHGYMARLEQVYEDRLIGFGPFIGYYFRPEDPGDLSRLHFVCFNEKGFYSSDMPDGVKLFEGTAVRITLPEADFDIPVKDRINPVFFDKAPQKWLESRPEPRDEYLHFHSCYSGVGPVLTGYWLRHSAVAAFTYDMGGRVKEGSPLYHRVQKGIDRNFAKIIEFDDGPKDTQR